MITWDVNLHDCLIKLEDIFSVCIKLASMLVDEKMFNNKYVVNKFANRSISLRMGSICTSSHKMGWMCSYGTAQKMKFSIKNFFGKYDQIRSFLRIWSHLLKRSLIENFIFCAVWDYFCLSYQDIGGSARASF